MVGKLHALRESVDERRIRNNAYLVFGQPFAKQLYVSHVLFALFRASIFFPTFEHASLAYAEE